MRHGVICATLVIAAAPYATLSRLVRENCAKAIFVDWVHNGLTWLRASISKSADAMFKGCPMVGCIRHEGRFASPFA